MLLFGPGWRAMQGHAPIIINSQQVIDPVECIECVLWVQPALCCYMKKREEVNAMKKFILEEWKHWPFRSFSI